MKILCPLQKQAISIVVLLVQTTAQESLRSSTVAVTGTTSCRLLKWHSGFLDEGCPALQVVKTAEQLPRHRNLHWPELMPEVAV